MTIAIISAKGGVGKTTTTANVGIALVKTFSRRVLAIDGNITTPTLGIHMGILSQERTLDDVLKGEITMQKAVYIHPCGLHIIPSSLSPAAGYPDTDVLKEKIKEVKDAYDVVLIDGAAGIGKEVISAIKASDDVLVVTNPDMASIVSAIKVLKIARNLQASIIGLALNRVTGDKHELKVSEVEELCEARVVATIPYTREMLRSIRKMTPIMLQDEGSPASEAFKRLAGYLIGEDYKPKEKFYEKILRKLVGFERHG